VQNRVTGSCPSGEGVRSIGADGTVVCEEHGNLIGVGPADIGRIAFWNGSNSLSSGSFAYHASNARLGLGLGVSEPGSRMGISGNLSIGSPSYATAAAPANGLIVEGNVGIGTTTPGAGYKLDVAGDARFDEVTVTGGSGHVIRGGTGDADMVIAGGSNFTIAGTNSSTVTLTPGNGNNFSFTGSGGTVTVNGNVTLKTFVIPHPVDGKKYLVHATLEGPEGAVYYRGTAALKNGRAEISLPAYFEALTHLEGRTALVTPFFTDDEEPLSPLAVGEVKNGRFVVKAIGGQNPGQKFHWEVKAIRKDVGPLEVEPGKSDVQVGGDGPYTYIKGPKAK
jgi:hypothetical protein